MKIQLQLMLEHAPPEKKKTKAYCKPSIEEQVRDAVTLCESGHESSEEWEFLRKVNNALMKKSKLNERQKNLLKLITPLLQKHASASGGDIELDSDKMAEAGILFK